MQTLQETNRVHSKTVALLLFASALLLFAAGGCGHQASIVGKWQITPPGSNVYTTVEFTPDGKETISGKGSQNGQPVNGTATGTYTVSGADLTQSITTWTMNGRNTALPLLETRPRPYKLDGEHLTLVDPSSRKSLTLTRVRG